MSKRRFSATEDSVPVGDPLGLAEAGFLRDALREKGIRARVAQGNAAGGPAHSGCTVMVPAVQLDAALEMRQALLPADRLDQDAEFAAPQGGMSPLDKAVGAGLLGTIVGLRVGHGSPRLTGLYCLGLGGLAFLAVLFGTKSRGKHEGGIAKTTSDAGDMKGRP